MTEPFVLYETGFCFIVFFDISICILQIVLKWFEEEVLVEGQIVTLPHRFKAGIEVESTFEELKRAAIVLGFTKDSIMKVYIFFLGFVYLLALLIVLPTRN